MSKGGREQALAEWNGVMKAYPTIARSILAQQMILVEASKSKREIIEERMCELIESGAYVPFHDYWVKRCNEPFVPTYLNEITECLTSGGDPADCFSLGNDDWFDDPFIEGRVLPGRPPIPPEY